MGSLIKNGLSKEDIVIVIFVPHLTGEIEDVHSCRKE